MQLIPIVTEKTTRLSEKAKYVLKVPTNASKIQVKKLFKELYGVDAAKVNVIQVTRKTKSGRSRKEVTKRSPYKKVVVTTKDRKQVDLSKLK